MSSCNTCPSNGSCSEEQKSNCMIENNPLNNVKHIIGVMSGKGGVGKSTISTLLAYELLRNGYKVGLMDADITGPSIPRLVNMENKRITSTSEKGMVPLTAIGGLKVMSANFLVDSEDAPILWRGPLVGNLVKQFWTEVIWGELDYLIVDMPPGTSDVALTAMQVMPFTGVVMVSVPQDMVSMIVAKAINMAEKMNVPVLGIIENMSYIECPDCGKKIRIFEDSTEKFIKDNYLRLLCELPMSKDLVNLSKKGIMKVNDNIIDKFSKVIEYITEL